MENILLSINNLTDNFRPTVGVVLGSGLGGFTSAIDIKYELPYNEIEGFPVSTVEGHDGKLIFGYVGEVAVVVMKGRFHYYEGYDISQVVLPIRVMRLLGVETLFLSNAAGAINKAYQVGDIMVLNNHVNFLPNPLIGKNDSRFGERFPDMKNPYSSRIIAAAHAYDNNLQEGVYIGLTGPSYETAAEIHMYRVMGCDAVGMSTVPEVITACHAKMEVFAVSVITNDTSENEVTHEEVMAVGAAAGERMSKLFYYLISTIANY